MNSILLKNQNILRLLYNKNIFKLCRYIYIIDRFISKDNYTFLNMPALSPV